MSASLLELIVEETVDAFWAKSKEFATSLELAIDTWRSGDPTRTLLYVQAKIFESLEATQVAYIKAGFLDFADRLTWLPIKAKQDYDVDVVEAEPATCFCTLTNATGLPYAWDPRELIVSRGDGGPTYRNTEAVSLGALGTETLVAFEADEAGSDSNATAGAIDTIVTTSPGVTVTNTSAAVGTDAETASSIRTRCRAKMASLSPNGPPDAYVYIATTPSLSGATNVTKAFTVADSETGDVTLYISNAGGAVSVDDHDAVASAIANLCAPLCITPSVVDATPVTQAVTYEAWIYDSANLTADEVKELVEAALAEMVSERPLGGDIIASAGTLSYSLVLGTILGAHEEIFRVNLATPATNVAINPGEVILLGSVTGTINIVSAP